ncbi:FMN-binding negative transcriptional regulator [Verticiella sediminum]|uniref:FMN-binding negative transcriptional regulator n=1 Tax=Verticiella sediminum TaxID=1247510 RepID=A0A556AYR3_9BURK|nr:FMN-binding negative transcriptional regulator [Verticiella sediminum]TSH98080.1 FMN-binding negative transcriptional regulator [Verticiella sediminum]
MYIPSHFAEHRPEELARIIREYPLGVLVTHRAEGLDANHLPFEFDPDAGAHGVLKAHVARANPVWQRGASGSPVMVVFRGAEGYVSPNGYPSKHEAHRQVPTWNYEVVHAHGLLTVCDDERFVRGVVARLTRRHEAGEARPWKMSDATPEFIDGMLRNIVGIEIAVTSLVGKRKLSQNKEERDIRGAGEALQAKGLHPIGAAMLAAAAAKRG